MRVIAPGQSMWNQLATSVVGAKRKRSLWSSSPGFTLVEVLVATAIIGIVATALSHILSLAFTLSDQSESEGQLTTDAAFAITLLENDIREADDITELTASKITLRLNNSSVVTYSWDRTPDSPLYRKVDLGANEILCEGVLDLEFGIDTLSKTRSVEYAVIDTVVGKISAFEPGDWDKHADDADCDFPDYYPSFPVNRSTWAGEYFTAVGSFDSWSKIWIRSFRGHTTPDDYLMLEIFDVDGFSRPSNRLAYALFDHITLTTSEEWYSKELTVVDGSAITAGSSYFIVCRPASNRYAGYIGREILEDCDWWPSNGMYFSYTNDAGYHWAGFSNIEMFHYIDGAKCVSRVEEITAANIDTLGVSYYLKLAGDGVGEDHGGYFAWSSL